MCSFLFAGAKVQKILHICKYIFPQAPTNKKYIYTMYIYSTRRKKTSFSVIFTKYLPVILWLSYGYPVAGYATLTLKKTARITASRLLG